MAASALVPLGAAQTVTGSKFLIEHQGRRVLVDAGLFQGLKDLRERNWSPFPVDPASLDAVIISHAHLDHCGYLPRLVKGGFAGDVHVTFDTGRLMSVVLPDSARLQEEEAKYANRSGYSRHQPALALYTEDDAWAALEQLRSHPFDEPFEAASGITVTFRPAGHILGSATVRVALAAGPTV
ncbi:MAG: MBL fold metallo-hydrolase, partial [Actinomycetota bacterium]